MNKFSIVLAGLLALAACGEERSGEGEKAPGEQVSGEKVADRLEEAADQSGPAAEEVLENAAEAARERESMAPVSEPGSFAQRAMQKAGKAEAQSLSSQPAE